MLPVNAPRIACIAACSLVLSAASARAEMCTGCGGTGHIIKGFGFATCKTCGGSGTIHKPIMKQLGIDTGY